MGGPPSVKAVRVRIIGRVQGVWFRAWTVERATALGLDGWVRNCRDGSVEAAFSGATALVDEMLRACRDGPPLALVDRVETVARESGESGGEAAALGSGFRQRPTR